MTHTDQEDTVPIHRACGLDHLPDTPCPELRADRGQRAAADELAQEMRALLQGRADAKRVARVQIADRLAELAQQLHDREILTLVDAGLSQSYLAEQLGITKQAVSYRVHNAREREERRART